jgi:hypothetical protein
MIFVLGLQIPKSRNFRGIEITENTITASKEIL